MFSKEVTTSDLFVDMPLSSQLLYFHLGMEADDEGFIGNAKMLSRAYGTNNDDLKLLEAKGFILVFSSGVTVVKDWNLNNKIRKDRQKPTIYTEEKNLLALDSKGSYHFDNQVTTFVQPNDNHCTTIVQPNDTKESHKNNDKILETPDIASMQPNDNQMSAQDRIGKDRLGEYRKGKNRIDKESKEKGKGSDQEFEEYISLFIDFAIKNKNNRAMAQVLFLDLPPFQRQEALIGAKHYLEWYRSYKPEDTTGQFSINAEKFLNDLVFTEWQEKPKPKAYNAFEDHSNTDINDRGGW